MNTNKCSRRSFLKAIGAGLAAMSVPGCAHAFQSSAGKRSADTPNIVIIFTDDQGYQDLGCFGSPDIDTPNIDRMASEGVRFTDMHVAQPVCGASRAALLTGCYSNRIGILGAPGPNSKRGISDNEMTIAQLVKQRDYATAIFGKWHLGDSKKFLPLQHGFDEYFGLPYSNDMWPNHPSAPPGRYPPLPLIEGNDVIQLMPDQTQLTTWYTEHAVNFINKNKDNPFFLYVAHNMPHVPLFVSDKFKGKSKRGIYGDVIMEIDWSVGQILKALKTNGLDENTLVIYTSDNGPWLVYGDHAGRALPLREGKGTTWDGGQREPCVMRWPGKIPAGSVCDEPVMTIDLFPTIARLTKTKLPDHKIDGLDIWPLMAGQKGAKSPHDALYFYWGNNLEAIRSGKWKLHLPHDYRSVAQDGGGGKPGKYEQKKIGLALYDIKADISESKDLAREYPDVVQRLKAKALAFDEQLQKEKRPPGDRDS